MYISRRKKKCARLKSNLLQQDEDEDDEDCEFNDQHDLDSRGICPTKLNVAHALSESKPQLLHPMSILQQSSSPTKSNINIARSNFLYSKTTPTTTTPSSNITSTRHD